MCVRSSSRCSSSTGVDVVFSGHEHFYERLKPQNGIAYFISGAGGKLRRGDIRRVDPMAFGFDTDRSFMLVEIVDKEMYFQAISAAGKVVDSGVIPNAPDPERSSEMSLPAGARP